MTELDIDCSYTSTLICPYCGYDNGNDDVSHDDTGYEFKECYECEKTFSYWPNVTVTFTSYKVPCANGEGKHSWRFMGVSGTKRRYHCQHCDSTKACELEEDNINDNNP